MSDRPTVSSLLAANERFYHALETLDYATMAELWEDSDRAFCVHPGWPPLRGAKPVLESWRRIMENTAEIRFTLTGEEAHIEGDIGVVTVYEHIANRVGHERQSSGAISTNLFAYDAQAHAWRLFHHHASPTPQPEGAGNGLLV